MADTSKVWKASRTASAGMTVTENTALMVASEHAVAVNNLGVTIVGPISMTTDSKNRRTAGLFVGVDDMLEMIPSTVITPLPSHLPVPPVHGLLQLKEDIEFFKALLV